MGNFLLIRVWKRPEHKNLDVEFISEHPTKAAAKSAKKKEAKEYYEAYKNNGHRREMTEIIKELYVIRGKK
jgi:hypothetical protein